MSIDHRLRNGLQPTPSDRGPDTMEALQRVERRVAKRARTTRAGVGALLAAVVVLVIGGSVAVWPDDRSGTDQVAVDGSSVAAQQLDGTYVVDVPDSREARQEGMVGRWVVTLADGAVELRPPPAYAGATLGAAYRVTGDELRTDALVEPGCQVDSGFVGTYGWAISGELVSFTARADTCVPRQILFAGQAWDRVP